MNDFSPNDRRWRIATIVLVVLWVIAVARLTIADVWDETVGVVAFSSTAQPFSETAKFLLTQSLGFWRPIPSLFAAAVIRLAGRDLGWVLLRATNIALLLATLRVLLEVIRRWDGRAARRDFVVALTFLYSSAAIICATWYANLFDVWTLALIAVALLLMTRERFIAAGVVIGVAFFCKETAALALPMLLLLVAAKRIRFVDAVRTGIPATILGAVFFAIRSRIIPFGSASDVHGFAAKDFLPTLWGLVQTWWVESLAGSPPHVLGIAAFILSIFALRGMAQRAAFVVFVIATAVIYWQMTTVWQGDVLMHYLMFVGRLYLVPVTIAIVLLALDRRTIALALLAIPLLLGAARTYRNYERFQRTYERVYRMAKREGPLRVHYAMKPMADPVRKVEVCDCPDAPARIEPSNGAIEKVAGR